MVYFVGAGTGAADLITVRGMRYLEQADVIIYAGSLVNPQLLDFARPECEIYNSAKMTLEEVIAVMEAAEEKGKKTVRLHTGDPSIYGAVREQMDILEQKGILYESCPGVSACFGAAASLNLEYTLPGISQSLIITRMEGRTKVPQRESIESFAAHGASMAIYLSTGLLEELEQSLTAGGYSPDTPAAIVYKATWPEEKAFICTVSTLSQTAREHQVTRTAVILVGEAVAHRGYERSRLYAPEFETGFRKKSAKDIVGVRTKTKQRISVISFTERGRQLAERIKRRLGAQEEVSLCEKPEEGLAKWTEKQFADRNAIVFVGACGIAVRATAPCVKDKLEDSPVVVIDEVGSYVIPILSGHAGGANELAEVLAEALGAVPVITTATDINGKFAVDIFAKKNQLTIQNKDGIAKISGKLLRGEKVSVSVEDCEEGVSFLKKQLPEELILTAYPPGQGTDIVISTDEDMLEKGVLKLKPKEYVLGIGCKKGKGEEEIDALIREQLARLGISTADIAAIASIDQKKEEAGICGWAHHNRIPYLTFTKEQLQSAEGNFHGSAFVRQTVGVDNVCERSALMACGEGGELVLSKYAQNGITLAVARRKWNMGGAEYEA